MLVPALKTVIEPNGPLRVVSAADRARVGGNHGGLELPAARYELLQ